MGGDTWRAANPDVVAAPQPVKGGPRPIGSVLQRLDEFRARMAATEPPAEAPMTGDMVNRDEAAVRAARNSAEALLAEMDAPP